MGKLQIGMRDLALLLILMVLVGVQMQHFLVGYRLTADDALFFQWTWHGAERIWHETLRAAIYSGRIGHFLMTPLNVLGAYFSGNGAVRFLMVGAYFGMMAALAAYVARLTGAGRQAWLLGAFVAIALLSLHPLAYDHMPPNSYPLQNTLPFLLLIGCRWWLWERPGMSAWGKFIVYCAAGLMMLVSEFVIMLAVALTVAEYCAMWQHPEHKKFSLRPRLIADGALLLLVVTIYLVFRLAFPSEYPGNTPDGLREPFRVLSTMMHHVLAGTSPYRFDLAGLSIDSWQTAAIAIFVGMLTLAASHLALDGLAMWRNGRLLLAPGVMAIALLCTTFPLAITARHQHWCLDAGACGYLDSRVAYMGVGWILALPIVMVFMLMRGRSSRRAFSHAVALTMGLLAAGTHLYNDHVAHAMRANSQVWDRAKFMACQSDADISEEDVAHRIDPEHLVVFHADVDRTTYWREYADFLRDSGRCGESARRGDRVPSASRQHIHILMRSNS